MRSVIRKEPESGEIWEHYKGKKYHIIAVGKHTETLQWMVTYMALYEPFDVWIRPLSMFMEDVTFAGERVPRFERYYFE